MKKVWKKILVLFLLANLVCVLFGCKDLFSSGKDNNSTNNKENINTETKKDLSVALDKYEKTELRYTTFAAENTATLYIKKMEESKEFDECGVTIKFDGERIMSENATFAEVNISGGDESEKSERMLGFLSVIIQASELPGIGRDKFATIAPVVKKVATEVRNLLAGKSSYYARIGYAEEIANLKLGYEKKIEDKTEKGERWLGIEEGYLKTHTNTIDFTRGLLPLTSVDLDGKTDEESKFVGRDGVSKYCYNIDDVDFEKNVDNFFEKIAEILNLDSTKEQMLKNILKSKIENWIDFANIQSIFRADVDSNGYPICSSNDTKIEINININELIDTNIKLKNAGILSEQTVRGLNYLLRLIDGNMCSTKGEVGIIGIMLNMHAQEEYQFEEDACITDKCDSDLFSSKEANNDKRTNIEDFFTILSEPEIRQFCSEVLNNLVSSSQKEIMEKIGLETNWENSTKFDLSKSIKIGIEKYIEEKQTAGTIDQGTIDELNKIINKLQTEFFRKK